MNPVQRRGYHGRYRVSATAEERFWPKVLKTETCWLWQGALVNESGYGCFRGPNGRNVLAHRFAWELTNGPIPDGMFACHRCDVRQCVNPAHLFLGTQQDNIDDMMRKGRGNQGRKTHCPQGHEYTPENRYRQPSRPNTVICRICKAKHAAESLARCSQRRRTA